MTKVKTFVILYDNLHSVFMPGDFVRGQIILKLTKTLSLTDIQLQTRGTAKVKFECTQDECFYKDVKIYNDLTLQCFGSRQEQSLNAGDHLFEFTFPLPDNLPATFEGRHGYIRYFCTALINGTKKNYHTSQTFFNVVAQLDLNREPLHLKNPVSNVLEKHILNVCCCTYGNIQLQYRLNKQMYVPGECVIVTLMVNNESNGDIDIANASIIQHTYFHGRRIKFRALSRSKTSTKTHSACAVSYNFGSIDAGEIKTWNDIPLEIPALPPSKLNGCDIIDLAYSVQFCISGSHIKSIGVSSDIVIGTIPLYETFPVIEGRNGSIDNISREMPPPTYEECLLRYPSLNEQENGSDDDIPDIQPPAYAMYRQLSVTTHGSNTDEVT